jgi:hypothetical protein
MRTQLFVRVSAATSTTRLTFTVLPLGLVSIAIVVMIVSLSAVVASVVIFVFVVLEYFVLIATIPLCYLVQAPSVAHYTVSTSISTAVLTVVTAGTGHMTAAATTLGPGLGVI